MAQWTYRSGSYVQAGNGLGGNLTLAAPTGVADGDLIVVAVYFEPDTTNISITGGFTSAASQVNTGLFRHQTFYRIASSEPANYTVSNDTAGDQWRIAVAVAYQSGTGSGNRVDVSGSSQADGVVDSAQTAPTVTTTGTNRLLVYTYSNGSGNEATGITGAASNLRGSFGGTAIGDAARASAGATGTSAASGAGTQDYAAAHVAYISDIAAAAGRPLFVQVSQAVNRAGGW